MISSLVMTLVLSSAVGLATQIQRSYQSDLDGSVVEQEARYALDWIARDLRSAGSNPYAAAGQFLVFDPNGGADPDDSIRVQADVNPPNGDLTDDGEDITIALDAVNNVITRQDPNAADPAALSMTEAIFTDLQFTYLNASRNVTAVADTVAYIQVRVSAQSRGRNSTGQFTTSTLTTEVRLRTR
jgi:Tfp pilus assembly protein PilW